MKVKEFGAWPSHNVSSGGQKSSVDEYNRSLKKERYKTAQEYASKDIEEYHHYSETKDWTKESDDQESRQDAKKRSEQKARSARQRVLQQVVALVAGSVIVVSSYQAITERENGAPVPPPDQDTGETTDNTDDPTKVPIILSAWKWSDDKQTVVLEFSDNDGNVIKVIPAAVNVTETEATCGKEGTRTYTATANDEEKTYSDLKSETLPPLGHSFDSGTNVVLENGHSGITYECTRCREQFTFDTSWTEND